jgi:hypothetical protein
LRLPASLRLTGSGVNAVEVLRKQSVRVNVLPARIDGPPPAPGCQFFNTLLTQVWG